MKKDILKLLLKLFVLFSFISALLFYCEIRLREIPNSYTIKKKYFEKNLNSIQVLILGSSESVFGINPQYFSIKGFNLAEESQSLYYDKEITVKYLDKMPQLKFVLISVSYFSLGFQLYVTDDDWRDYYYFHFWNTTLNNNKKFDIKQISYIALYGSSFSQNAFRKNFKINTGYENLTENGWRMSTVYLDYITSYMYGKLRAEGHSQLINFDFLEPNTNYLDILLNEITHRNITPVFITTPVYKSYFSNMDTEKVKIMKNTINKLCKKYNCKYFDYSNDLRFETNDFADPHHLNYKGAEKFSKIIDKEILTQN